MNGLKYLAFIKSAEYGSITKAAEMLNYSQSGISRMIADLEAEWNVSLLERGKKGVKLTSDGEVLLPYAKNLCDQYEKLRMQVDDIRGVQSGIIKIGTISSVAIHWLPKIIKAFQKDFPGIDYELLLGDYTEIEEWIKEGRVDCGFYRNPKDKSLEIMHLAREHLVAILPENHPLANVDKVPIEALCKEPFLLLEKGAKAEISEVFERNGLSPRVHFTTWDDYAIMALVEAGLGISMLPDLILKRVPYKIVTKELTVSTDIDTYFVLRDKKAASVAVKKFMDYLKYRA